MIISLKRAILIADIIFIAIVIAVVARNSHQTTAEVAIEVKPQPEPISAKYTPNLEAQVAIYILTDNQRAWLRKLIQCESSGNPKAINPKDRDLTPSYGLLQFKPETFYGFAKQYGIEVTDVMDPDQQIEIVSSMIIDSKNINWAQQFPVCSARYGQPPVD